MGQKWEVLGSDLLTAATPENWRDGDVEQPLGMRQISRIKKGLMRRIAVSPKYKLGVLQESQVRVASSAIALCWSVCASGMGPTTETDHTRPHCALCYTPAFNPHLRNAKGTWSMVRGRPATSWQPPTQLALTGVQRPRPPVLPHRLLVPKRQRPCFL